MKKRISVFFAVLICAVEAYSIDVSDTALLKTPHFIIKYNPNSTPYAAVIADRAETHYRAIESFLSYSLNEELKIAIYDDCYSSLSPEYNSIKLSSASNFYDTDDKLYSQIFIKFYRSMSRQTSELINLKPVNDYFVEMLCRYSAAGFNINNELILRDYFLNREAGKINIVELNNYKDDSAEAVYSGFFYFLESSYGRKVMLRALKDAAYYGSFANSLNSITGKANQEINSEFNSFLSAKFSGNVYSCNNNPFSDIQLNGNIKDFLIFKDKLAALVDIDGNSFIEIMDLHTGKTVCTEALPKNIIFKRICHVDNNQLAVTGNSSEGTTVCIYNTDPLLLSKTMIFPGIYTNTITNSGEDEYFLFNSVYGISKGIIKADYNKLVRNKIRASHIAANSDIVLLGDSVYYIAKRDFYELIEVNIKTGAENSLLKLKDEISSLTISRNNIVLTANNPSGGYVSLFDTENGSIKSLVSGCSMVYNAYLSNEMVYILAYYNGSRRIIVKEIPR